MYRENYPKARFYIQFGPTSLFKRVRFKMKDAHKKKWLFGYKGRSFFFAKTPEKPGVFGFLGTFTLPDC